MNNRWNSHLIKNRSKYLTQCKTKINRSNWLAIMTMSWAHPSFHRYNCRQFCRGRTGQEFSVSYYECRRVGELSAGQLDGTGDMCDVYYYRKWLFPSFLNYYNPQKHTRLPLLWLRPRRKTILRLLDLVLFLVIQVLLLSAVLSFWPVVTLAGNEQPAGEQDTKD